MPRSMESHPATVSWLAVVAATIILFAASFCGCGGNQTASDLGMGTIATVAGTGKRGDTGNGGPAISAELYQPACAVFDSAGNLYIGDIATYTVRKVAARTGIISLYAGNGVAAYSGDGGPAISASLYGPTACALDSAGNLYLADDANNVIREVTASTGIITTVAGNGYGAGTPSGGFSGDGGLATNAEINHPWGVAVDSTGDIFISDTLNQRVREVDGSTGIITTIAGNGRYGYSGSGGEALNTMIANPDGLALDSFGNLYIAEQAACVIAKLNLATDTISTVAGSGTCAASVVGDGGPATQAQLTQVPGVAIDTVGNIFISDWVDSRVREVVAATGIILSVVGTTQGYSGNAGPADRAQLSDPWGLFFDASGDLYIADSGNAVIRKVTP
jgi:trimeric autotransporter adhesin